MSEGRIHEAQVRMVSSSSMNEGRMNEEEPISKDPTTPNEYQVVHQFDLQPDADTSIQFQPGETVSFDGAEVSYRGKTYPNVANSRLLNAVQVGWLEVIEDG